MTLRKSSFTLLEILIAISILASALMVIGINAPKLLQKERFERGVEQVLDEISFAEEVMLLDNINITLSMKIVDKGLHLSCSTEESHQRLNRKWSKPLLIKGIEKICFNGEAKDSLDLIFNSDLFQVTQGTLTFCCKAHQREIYLPLNQHDEKKYKKPIYPEEIFSSL